MNDLLQESPVQTQPAKSDPQQTFAAVDLGSNSFHLIVACRDHGDLRILDRHKEMVRLAAGLDEQGYLSLEARNRGLRCLARMGQRLRHLPHDHVRVVATNTLRRAINARAFLIAGETVIGHHIEIVSGYEEARLIYKGIGYGLPRAAETRVVIDIGGGSTEFVRGRGDNVLTAESLGYGCVGLSRKWFPDGKITPGRWRQAHDAVTLELQGLDNLLQETGDEEFVGSSGTIRAAARVCTLAGWCEAELTREAIIHLRDALLDAGHVDKLSLEGLSDHRRPVFPGGVVMLQACFEVLGIPRLRIAQHALREGVLCELVGRYTDDDPRATAIDALATRYRVDRHQAERVTRTSQRLFDQAARGWGLERRHRGWLTWAAGVHEIGLAISHSKYHLHGAYILQNSDLAGFSRQDQTILAILVQAHRRKPTLEEDADIPDREFIVVQRLVALLRLAVLLHRARSALPGIDDVVLNVEENKIVLTFPDDWLARHPLTRLDLNREAGLLAQAGFDLAYS